MFGTKTTITSLLFAATLTAASSEYFPLQVGNSWVYRADGRFGKQTQTIEVEAKQSLEGQEYARVTFFGKTLYLRTLPDGAVMSYDAEAKREKVWLPAGLAVGQTIETAMDDCSKTAVIESRTATVNLPTGDKTDGLTLRYRPNCADAGVTEQTFIPDLGLAVHKTTTLSGENSFELIYSRTGASTSEAKQIAVTMAVDKAVYDAGDEMLVRLSLRSTLPQPIELHFSSGQSFDLKIYDFRGEVVYVWSADKLFLAAVRRESFGPGERNYAFTVPLNRLPPGRYLAEAYVTNDPRQFYGTVGFELK